MKRHKNNEYEIELAIGKRIKAIRQKLGYSQEQTAKMLQITFQQMQKYERAINRISASRLLSMSAALGVPVTEFLPKTAIEGRQPVSPEELDLLITLAKKGINPAQLNKALKGDEE